MIGIMNNNDAHNADTSDRRSSRKVNPRDKAVQIYDSTAVKSVRAQIAPRYLELNLFLLFWLFVVGSTLGLVLEDIFHYIVYGGWESRAGLVWGSFSPIYGVGAVALTVFLNRFYYTHDIIIFLAAMLVGSTLEYATSWMMEVFWNAIAWDYTGTFGSINGRTNFVFGVMWGMLGLFWVRWVLPVVKAIQIKVSRREGMPKRIFDVVTWVLVVFMLVNAIVTVLAVHREGQRAEGVPAATPIDHVLDQTFPDEWLQERFHNMTVSADVGK